MFFLQLIKMTSQHFTEDPSNREASSDVIFLHNVEDKMITQQRSGSVKIWKCSDTENQLISNIDTKYVGFCSCQFSTELNLLFIPKNSSEISAIDCGSDSYNEKFIMNSSTEQEDADQFKNINCMKLIQHDDKSYILAGFDSGHLVLWNIETRNLVHFISFNFPIASFDFDVIECRGFLGSPESISNLHAFKFDKETCQLHRNENQDIAYEPRNMETLHGVSCIRIRPDRKLMFVGTYNGTIYIHSMKNLRLLTTLRHHRQAITDIVFSDHEIKSMKSKITAIAGGDVISFWDIYNKSWSRLWMRFAAIKYNGRVCRWERKVSHTVSLSATQHMYWWNF